MAMMNASVKLSRAKRCGMIKAGAEDVAVIPAVVSRNDITAVRESKDTISGSKEG